MNTPRNNEELARKLCEERWGVGSWDKGKINRAYWRRQARRKDSTHESRSS